jgi:hypothetical protein
MWRRTTIAIAAAQYWGREEAHERGERDAHWLPGLQEGGGPSSHPGRGGFGEEGVSHCPLAADPEARDQAEQDERPRPGGEGGERRPERVDEDRPRHHGLAAVQVGEVAEGDPPDAGAPKSDAEEPRLLHRRQGELVPDRDEEEREEDEVVEVEGPAREGDQPRLDGESVGTAGEERRLYPGHGRNDTPSPLSPAGLSPDTL